MIGPAVVEVELLVRFGTIVASAGVIGAVSHYITRRPK